MVDVKSVKPPNSPWLELKANPSSGGYLSYYFSDELSRLAVRAVTKERDNKADPNIETATYGMFSTCSKAMRKGVVDNRCGHVVFMTRRKSGRVISGYYQIGWYAPTNFAAGDFCLAAKAVHFVSDPIKFDEVKKRLGLRYSRLMLRLSPDQVSELVGLLHQRANTTDAYIAEIRRLEQFNFSRTGKRYVNFRWESSPDWQRAAHIFESANRANGSVAKSNKSESGWWLCNKCGEKSPSKSLLKCCPLCDSVASLLPTMAP